MQLWCLPAALCFWHGLAQLNGVTAVLTGLALCKPVLLRCCQCVFCSLLKGVVVRGFHDYLVVWLRRLLLLACYCVIISVVFDTVDEDCSQGQEIMLVKFLWSRPMFLVSLKKQKKKKKFTRHQNTHCRKGILLGWNILDYF